MTITIGINGPYHESAVALFKNHELIAFCEEERLNRIKHAKPALVSNCGELPLKSLSYCLDAAGVHWDQVDHIAYSFQPRERHRHNIAHSHPVPPRRGDFGNVAGEDAFRDGLETVPHQLAEMGFRGTFHWVHHHTSHAASAYYPSSFDEAVVLVVDGIGEWATTTIFHGKGTKLLPIWELCYPHSLGFVWEKICEFLGFTRYDAGKVMGLAAYGDPTRFRDVFSKLCATHPDGGFFVDEAILLPRNPEMGPLETLFGAKHRAERIINFEPATDQSYADIVAVLQETTETIMLGLVKKAVEMTGLRKLCLAGGVALNCVANAKILQSSFIDDIFIQPAAHDAGTAMGAALHVWHHYLRSQKRWTMTTPFIGPSFPEDQIRQTLDQKGLVYTKMEDINSDVAALLARDKVVAWFQGAQEVGPRALGHRSILADPRGVGVTERLNATIKFREHFRPFCPSVLEEHLDEWFHMPKVVGNTAEHMLAAFEVNSAQRKFIPAAVHEDGTCRLQALSSAATPHFHRLVTKFHELTGIPMVINTSFNKQEPIVCSPSEAVDTLMRTQIDYLAIGPFLVDRKANQIFLRPLDDFAS